MVFGDELKDCEVGQPGRTLRRVGYSIFVGISDT
jgi:hypothetical protein